MSQSAQEYKNLLTEVIKKQITILGPDITLAKVRKTKGISIDDTGTVTGLSAEPAEITKQLTEQFKEPVVVDYIADDSEKAPTLEYYEKTINDKHLISEIYAEQQTKLKDALGKALRKAKVTETKNGMRIVTVDVTGISKKNAFPGSSKLHNAIQIHFAQDGKPTASFIYTSEMLSFRATQTCLALGYSANKIVDSLKAQYGHCGFTGGGHNVASSSRFPKEYGKEILSTALKMVIPDGN